jgi:hypothetical protein
VRLTLLALTLFAGCAPASLAELEQRWRAAADPARPPGGDGGADPLRLVRVGGGLVGLLAGRDALVLLDEVLSEIDRAPAPPGACALAAGEAGELYAGGERSGEIFVYQVDGARLARAGTLAPPGLIGATALAAGAGRIEIVDGAGERWLTLDRDGAPLAERRLDPGPARVVRDRGVTALVTAMGHRLLVRDADGREREVRHDGPLWDVALRPGGELLIAVGGIEDAPLSRDDGAFGHLDSRLFFYAPDGDGLRRRAEVDLSALDVVTPRALLAEPDRVTVAAAGSPGLASFTWPSAGAAPALVERRAVVPGTAALVRLASGALALANPLADAWQRDDQLIPVEADGRDPELRLGEALLTTTLIAPFNQSDGARSRFTCESCHPDGYADGRLHHTGRGDAYVTTRAIRGLFALRPYFSRGLDPDLAAVAENEFRVANRGQHDPHFSLALDEVPWLRALGVTTPTLSSEALRRALLRALLEWRHRPNPRLAGRTAFTAEERAGAAAFAALCATCHAPRLLADRPETELAPEAWEPLVFAGSGALAWSRPERMRTTPPPWVHPEGARVPSLRRLDLKRPYLVAGGAADLAELLARVRRFPDGALLHDGDPPGAAPLDAATRDVLAAFLRLL